MTEWWAKYIGLPFGDSGGGINCWGLVRRVYADRLGVDLPAYGEISAKELSRIARAMDGGRGEWWQECGAEPMAVVAMRSGQGGRRVVHVGVMVDNRRVLHIEQATASVIIPITHYSISGRIAGFRRLADDFSNVS